MRMCRTAGKKKKTLLPKGSRADVGQFPLWFLLGIYMASSHPPRFLSSGDKTLKEGRVEK